MATVANHGARNARNTRNANERSESRILQSCSDWGVLLSLPGINGWGSLSDSGFAVKLPYIQFYVGDWRKETSVQSLSYHFRGILFEILCIMHECEDRGKLSVAGKPMPNEALEQLLHLDKQNLSTALTTLLNFRALSQEPDTGIIYSRRMVRDENIRKIRQNAGKKGGNPVLLKQKSTKLDKQTSNQTSDSEYVNEDDSLPNPSGRGCKGKPESVELVIQECVTRKEPESVALEFWNYYESNGWKVGKNKMSSWMAALSGWISRNHSKPNGNGYKLPVQTRRQMQAQREFPENIIVKDL